MRFAPTAATASPAVCRTAGAREAVPAGTTDCPASGRKAMRHGKRTEKRCRKRESGMDEKKAADLLRDYLENREMLAVVYAAICLAVDRLEGDRGRSVMEYREGRV